MNTYSSSAQTIGVPQAQLGAKSIASSLLESIGRSHFLINEIEGVLHEAGLLPPTPGAPGKEGAPHQPGLLVDLAEGVRISTAANDRLERVRDAVAKLIQ